MSAATADNPLTPESFARPRPDGSCEADFVVEGVHCPSCVRQIEGFLHATKGVAAARLNATTHRLNMRWFPDQVAGRRLLADLQGMGFSAVPFETAALAGGDHRDHRHLVRAMAIAGFAAANVMLLSVAVWAGLAADMGPATRGLFHWLSAVIALPAVVFAGRPFFTSAWAALRRGITNMDVPISLAVLLAGLVSVVETARGGPHVYFDAALTLLFFLLVGRVLDHGLRARAQDVARNLLLLRAPSAQVIEDAGTRTLPIGRVVPGMRVAVAAEARFPVDGRVTEGAGAVDDSVITGESAPRPVAEGDRVHAGTLNLSTPLVVEVTAADDASLLAGIVEMMAAAEQAKARYVRLADRLAGYYVAVVHGLAALTWVGWMLGGADWHSALMTALAVLVITCPCALGLAVPAVQVAAVGHLFRAGVLVKSGDALERLAAIDTVVFDKTGTLTTGRPRLRSVPDGIDEAAVAALAAASRHPLAAALRERFPALETWPEAQEVPGQGVTAQRDGVVYRLGQYAWLAAGSPPAPAAGPELWYRAGGAPPRRFTFTETARPAAAETVAGLVAAGLRVEMVSGDRRRAVADLADRVGIFAWWAARRPDQKIAHVARLRAAGRRVCMVGDGLNDAPALAAADVAISPSTASDLSQTKADFVFQGASLAPVLATWRLARRADRLVLQNIAFALAYNAVAIPAAMAGLVTPLIAALAMSGSSIVVSLNALRVGQGRAR